MGAELEVKYLAEESVFTELLKQSDSWTAYRMETSYYDTPDARLGQLHWTLRRRFENGVSVCTLKTPLGSEGRNEIEVECGDIHTAIPMLTAMGAPAALAEFAAAGIVEVCAARFDRMAGQVTLGDTRVELALDKGVLIGAGKEQPFVEVEVELKQGDFAAAKAYAEALAARYGMRREYRSKYARALILAGKGK